MTDWIEHNGGPQPVADDVWVETSRIEHGTHRDLARWIEWDYKLLYRILNQHLIDAARLEGIRLGLEAAMKTVCSAEVKAGPEAGIWHDSADWGRFAGLGEATDRIRALNPEAIAREAVLDQLTREAQDQGMGYEKDPDHD